MGFSLRPEQRAEMVRHADSEYPNEACGLIAGLDGRAEKVFPMRNSEESPVTYVIDSKDQFQAFSEMEEQGWKLLGIYHSHTHTEAYPSPTDVRLAAWPEAHYVIVSLQDDANPVLRAFRIQDGQVSEEELVVE